MQRRLAIVTIFVTCLGASVASAAGSATDAYTGATKFYGGVQVDVVNVETFVTDTAGRPVPGLGPEDFQLFVDGRQVPIINFFSVQGRGGGVEVDPGNRVAAAEGRPVPAPPEEQRLYLIVYVDNTTIQPMDRNRVIGHLEELIARDVGPTDRVMIVTSNPGLETRLRFSDPPEELMPTLDELRHETAGGTFIRSEERGILRTLQRMSTRPTLQGTGATAQAVIMDTRVEEAQAILDRIHSHCRWRYDGIVRTVSDLDQLMNALSGLPGRKALMYVGQGTAMRIGEPLFEAWVQRLAGMWSTVRNAPPGLIGLSPLAEANRYNVRRYFEELVTRANISRVTFYAVDASQASSLSHVSAEEAGFPLGENAFASRVFGQDESLQTLAAGTGGLHLTNLENIDRVVRDLANDFDSYYSLGFEPTDSADGSYHKIEVKVLREDVSVRHRNGFQTKSLDQRMAERLLAAIHLDIAPNPLAVELDQGDREATGEGRFRVPILVRIPIERLVLIPQADEYHGNVTVWVAISDGSGRMPEIHGRRIPVRIPADRLAEAIGQYVGYTVDLVVGSGPRRVALNVRDELASINSTVVFRLAPGDTTTVAALAPSASE